MHIVQICCIVTLDSFSRRWHRSYDDLWQLQSHEWEKHGTCAEELFPREVDFFNATLQLNEKANLEVSRAQVEKWLLSAHKHDFMANRRGAASEGAMVIFTMQWRACTSL